MPSRLLKVPHIPQQSSADCLAACAAMLLAFMGFRPNYARVTRILAMTPYGTQLRRITALAKHYRGVTVDLRSGDQTALRAAIDAGIPPIIFVDTAELAYHRYEGLAHTAVLVGYADESFYVNDPAFSTASQIVSAGELYLACFAFDNLYALVSRDPSRGLPN